MNQKRLFSQIYISNLHTGMPHNIYSFELSGFSEYLSRVPESTNIFKL